MAKYMQYAMAATKEALNDAKWHPQDFAGKATTVSFSNFIDHSFTYCSCRAYASALELVALKMSTIPLLLLPKRCVI